MTKGTILGYCQCRYIVTLIRVEQIPWCQKLWEKMSDSTTLDTRLGHELLSHLSCETLWSLGASKSGKFQEIFPFYFLTHPLILLYHLVDSEPNYQQLLKQNSLKAKTSGRDSCDVPHTPDTTVVSTAKWFWYPQVKWVRQMCDIKALWVREDPKDCLLSFPLRIFLWIKLISHPGVAVLFLSGRNTKSFSGTSEL